MEFRIRSVSSYKDVRVAIDNAEHELGLLDKSEVRDLSCELQQAVYELGGCSDCEEKDEQIAKLKQGFAERIVWWHSQLQDVLAEVRALDRVVADDLEAVMNQMWEAKDEVRK